MVRYEDFSSHFLLRLRDAGWGPDRRTDLTDWLVELQAEGYEPNPLATSILESLGGLTVQLPAAGIAHRPSLLVFDPIAAASGEFDRTEEWTRQLGLGFFPIGSIEPGWTIVWIGSDSQFYLGREFGLAFLGHTFREAMDWISIPDRLLSIVAD